MVYNIDELLRDHLRAHPRVWQYRTREIRYLRLSTIGLG